MPPQKVHFFMLSSSVLIPDDVASTSSLENALSFARVIFMKAARVRSPPSETSCHSDSRSSRRLWGEIWKLIRNLNSKIGLNRSKISFENWFKNLIWNLLQDEWENWSENSIWNMIKNNNLKNDLKTRFEKLIGNLAWNFVSKFCWRNQSAKLDLKFG